MGKQFRAYDMNQHLLLPPDLREWVPEGHLARFVSELVDSFGDLGGIIRRYDEGELRGQPPYHPDLMVKLLVYGYCTGRMSSRKLEQACYDDVAMRMLTCDQQPDHASIASFRVRHLEALREMFVQILLLCEKAGLVKLGRVAIDGTKIKANAAKRETHRYDKLTKMETELKEQVDQLLREAAAVDAQEDEQYGEGQRGDELPPELRNREARLKKIQAAKASLEKEAEEAEKAHQERKAEEKRRRAAGEKVITRKLKKLWKKNAEGQIVPLPSRQRNLNDLDARLMKDTATGNFIPAYNPQIAVDEEYQIIVANYVTQAGNDFGQLVPALLQVEANMERMPEQALADAGYFSPALIVDQRIAGVDLYVPPNKLPKPKPPPAASPEEPPRKKRKPNPHNLAIRTAMREKLDQPEAKDIYRQRSKIVEPPFATIKHVRGIRQFLLRGVEKVNGEFSLICATSNVMKLFRLNPEAVMN